MKTAVVHDWLVTYAGAERCLEQILLLYPEADIFSLVDFIPEGQRGFIQDKAVNTSFIQGLPLAKKKYRSYLPLMPLAVEKFDLQGYDLVISSSHAVAKGARTTAGQTHVCYCHTPMRYAWDLRDQYLRESGLDRGLKGLVVKGLLEHLRKWDFRTAKRVDYFIANSRYIAKRIQSNYDREAAVIYPPVDIENFSLETSKENFYLAASRMVPYKRMDLIVDAFSLMPDKKLIVIGDGPDFGKVQARTSSNVELLGYQATDILKDYMQRAKAFVFAAEEDFGITPVEAQACGTPVIAFGKGGATETVIENKTGIFFSEHTPESIMDAVRTFEHLEGHFKPSTIRQHAETFSATRFRLEFKQFIERVTAR